MYGHAVRKALYGLTPLHSSAPCFLNHYALLQFFRNRFALHVWVVCMLCWTSQAMVGHYCTKLWWTSTVPSYGGPVLYQAMVGHYCTKLWWTSTLFDSCLAIGIIYLAFLTYILCNAASPTSSRPVVQLV